MNAEDGSFLDFDFGGGRVYALGLTYADHLRETGERPGLPALFLKHCAPLPADSAAMALPDSHAIHASIASLDPALADWLTAKLGSVPALLDYEVEIGIALFDDATLQQLDDPGFQPALGYFVANDLTARSVQIAGEGAHDRLAFWSAAKSFPAFLPTGSRVWRPERPGPDASMLPDLLSDLLPDLVLETRVNGEVRQRASTRECLYSVRQMLQMAARAAPGGCLRSGDLVLTGTPAGIALSVPRWKRQLAQLLPRRQRIRAALQANLHNRRFLQPGDRLEFSAGWLGRCELLIK